MLPHRLDPLLRSTSLAVVGASTRPNSVGNEVIRQLVHGGYAGSLYPINPRYDAVEGVACYGALSDLPEAAEHVVLAVPNSAVEETLKTAIARGAKAATIYSSLYLPEDGDPPLTRRVAEIAREAGVALCGANGMGFYNFADKIWCCGFRTRPDHRAGNVALITHSGSVFCALVDSEARIDYNLAVSPGQELVTTLADYLDFALEMPTTRVAALFMETARDPEGFAAALEKASAKGIPVVALKLGRSAKSAALATSHSGALVGDDGAYQALFERYGVIRVNSIDEMAMTLMVLAQPNAVGPGGLAAIHDSGGERELFIDLAEDAGVPCTELSPATVSKLEARLEPGLPAVNPLDAWGTGNDYYGIFTDCFRAMMEDEGTSLGAIVADRAPGGEVHSEYPIFARAAQAATGKPVFIVSNHQGSGFSELAVELTREGIPVLDGVPLFLSALRHAFAYRDFRTLPPMLPPEVPEEIVAGWRHRLSVGAALDEAEGLRLLADFGIPTVPALVAESLESLGEALGQLCFPVVLKTAMPGVLHKSDVDGVRLGLLSSEAVTEAYQEMALRLGERVLVAPMVEGGGVEMILGVKTDAQFGPTVLLGIGGIHAELLRDVTLLRPPFDAAVARRALDRLKMRRLLDGLRGAPACDIEAFCEAAARLSVLAAGLGDLVSEIDVNPIILRSDGCVAVDAVVLRAQDSA
ncbi:MAG: acetate--CoA ligase family protein [Rhodovibrionaceae bacterium]